MFFWYLADWQGSLDMSPSGPAYGALSQGLTSFSILRGGAPVHVTVLCAIGAVLLLFICQNALRHISISSARRKNACQEPPQYPHTDWSGRDLLASRQAASAKGRQMAHYDECFAKLGHTWVERLPGQRLINTINAANIQHALTFDTEEFGRGGKYHQNELLGPGILSSDGPRWKFSRDMIRPIFTKAEISDTKMPQRHIDRLIAQLPRDGRTVDIQPLMKKLFFDISTEFIFGESANSLLPSSPFADGQFLDDFNYAMAGVLKRRKAGIFSFQYYFDRRYSEAIRTVHTFIDRHVTRALGPDAKPSDRYVLLYELAKQVRDPIVLRYEILNVFAPSRDTVAILVGNALFRLARHPAIWQDLRAEALSLGDKPNLSFGVLKALTSFRNVVSETLRTTGPSGRIVRTARKDAILPRGGGPDGTAPVFVGRGDQIAIFFWGLHHDKAVWGEDSYKFRPDRWNNIEVSRWQFVPFSGGRRICPANQHAVVQAICILVRLTREFESIENRDPVEEYVELQKMLTESRHGVKIALNPAA